MVTVRFKLSDLRSAVLPLTMPTQFEKVLEMCAEHTGSPIGPVIAVTNEKVINLQDKVEDDIIDDYPALSSG